jgi:monoamine oxidase
MDDKGHSGIDRLTRRRFLALTAAAAASQATGLGLGSADDATAAADSSGKDGRGREVIVLGGGLAGLCAAFELRNKGYRVLAVLEAQNRTGGRVRTIRSGFANGQYAELGAVRIPDSHPFTLGYMEQFGLEQAQFSSGNGLYYLKGKPPFVHADGDPWPADVLPGLTGEDATLGADSISLKYDHFSEIINPSSPEFLGDPNALDWPTGYAATLIPLSYQEYQRRNGASDDAFLINRAINGSELFSDGALYWIAADVVDATWDKTFAIKGGNDQLPRAFTTALGDIVKYGCVATGIHQGARRVHVTFTQAGRTHAIHADRVVCALPFSTLRDLRIAPAFPGDKTEVIENLRMMPVSRCCLQTKSRFWQNRGIGGLKIARTDTGIDRFWHHTDVQEGETGIIGAYMQNQTGVDYAAAGGNFNERSAYVRGIASAFFPELDDEVIGGIEKIWQNDQWVKGGWGFFGPGEQGMFPVAKRPESRVHFCGEHTSAWSGWMQGAFESANRVVNEMTA